MNTIAKLALATALGTLCLPGLAAAQQSNPNTARVGDVNGQAMASHAGKEYTQLTAGETVGPSDSIMVSPNSSVVLNVTDGTRAWTVTLPPGTYKITPGLLRTTSGATLASQSVGNLTFTVGAIVGAAALGAAAMEAKDTVPPLEPVSR